ncbi:hypothetical protein PENTCL1PPCAC_5270, partial [Pristionchus entomophagus]
GTISAKTPAKLVLLVSVIGCPIPLFVVIWIYRRFRSLILRLLEKKSKAMSIHTKHVHRQFVTILTIQAGLPFFVMLGIGIYALGLLELVNSPSLEVATFILVEIPALISPIVVVMHIRSYHEAVITILHCRTSRPPSVALFPNHILDVPLSPIRSVTPLTPRTF